MKKKILTAIAVCLIVGGISTFGIGSVCPPEMCSNPAIVELA